MCPLCLYMVWMLMPVDQSVEFVRFSSTFTVCIQRQKTFFFWFFDFLLGRNESWMNCYRLHMNDFNMSPSTLLFFWFCIVFSDFFLIFFFFFWRFSSGVPQVEVHFFLALRHFLNAGINVKWMFQIVFFFFFLFTFVLSMIKFILH